MDSAIHSAHSTIYTVNRLTALDVEPKALLGKFAQDQACRWIVTASWFKSKGPLAIFKATLVEDRVTS